MSKIGNVLFLYVFIYILSFAVTASNVDYSEPVSLKSGNGFGVNYIENDSGISVLEFSGDYSRNIEGQYNAAARQVVLEELYKNVDDNYDFVVFFTTFPVDSGEASAFYGAVKNDVLGIGVPQFDYQSFYGSDKLQGMIDMTELSDWNWNPSKPQYSKLLNTLTHEMMHRWGPQVSFLDEGINSDLMLGRDLKHWNYFLNSQASVMYGSLWHEQAEGVFKTTAIRKSLSPLDLYLMGMRDSSGVPDFFIIKEGSPGNRNDLPPIPGTEASGIKHVVSIDDVISAEGQRVPNASNAQHDFNVHFVLLKRPGDNTNVLDIGRMLVLQKQFQNRFHVETSGVGQIIYQNRPETSGQNNTLPYDINTRADFDLNAAKQFLFNHLSSQTEPVWADKPGTVIKDTSQIIPILQLLDEGSILANSVAWINETQAKNNDDMAWMLLSGHLSQENRNMLKNKLHNNRNSDGGWGIGKGSSSTPYDTALVLLALKKAFGTAFSPDSNTLVFLQSQLNDNYGAGYSRQGVSNLTGSAILFKALHQLSGFSSEQNALGDYIVSLQQADGGFGNAYDTVMALDALRLSTNVAHNASVSDALIKLNSMQSVDGSLEGSVYTTALAMALLAGEQRPDIAIMEVTAANSAIEGEQVAVDVRLKNTGNAETGLFRLAVNHDSVEIDYLDVAPMAIDEERNLTLVFNTTGISGEQVVTIQADAHDQVAEINELNNETEINIHITEQSGLPELAIQLETLTYEPQTFDALPFEFNSSFGVINLSSNGVNDVEVGLFSEDEQGTVQSHATVSIDLNANVPVAIDLSSIITEAAGDLNLYIMVDPNQRIDEVNEENNRFDILLPQIATVDLQILAEDVTLPAAFVKGQESTVSFDLSNLGTQITPGFEVKAQIEGDTIDETLYENNVTELVGGEVVNRQFLWVPEELGLYTLTITLDEADTVSEVNETNNEVQFSVEVVENSLTNIYIESADVTLSPNPGLTGKDNQLVINIHNNSNTPVSDFSVQLFEQFSDGSQVYIDNRQITDTVVAGGSLQVSIGLLNSHYVGDTTFVVKIDADEQVPEFNENDNLVIKQFQFLSQPDAMVTPGGMSLTPTQPIADQNLLLNAIVSNLGEQVLSNLTLDWYAVLTDDSTQWIGQTSISEVSGGGSENSQLNYLFPNDINIQGFLIRADEGLQINESNEQNNEALLLITQQDKEFYLTDDIFSPNGDGVQDETRFVFNTNTTDDYSIAIYDFRDRLIKQFNLPAWQNSQTGDVVWDGRDNKNNIVNDGDYRVSLLGNHTGLSKHLSVAVDTNRTAILESLVNESGTFYDLRCITHSDNMQGDFGLNHTYYFTRGFRDLNNIDQHGLFKIKTDASDIKSILPSIIQTPQFIQISNNQGLKPIADGGIVFRYYENDDRLIKVNSKDGSYQVLNTDGLTDYDLEAVYDDFVLVKVDYEYYYKVFYDVITEPQLMSFQTDGNGIRRVKRLDLLWEYFIQGGNDDSPYIAPLNNLSNYRKVSDDFNTNAEINSDYYQKTRTLAYQSEDQIKLYRSDGNEIFIVRELILPSEVLKFEFTDSGHLVTVIEGQIVIFDSNGAELGVIDHNLVTDYFHQNIIYWFGSLDTMEANSECGQLTHSYDELDDIYLEISHWVLNQTSENELYIDFGLVFNGEIDIEGDFCNETYTHSFGSGNGQINLKIKLSDEGTVSHEKLEDFNIKPPKSYSSKQLIESQGPYFSMADDVYFKDTAGIPNQYPVTLWEDFDLNDMDESKVSKSKFLINSESSPNAQRCSQAGEPALGFYQGTDNLTAFITAKSNQSGIEIEGSAFDRHFKEYTIEARQVDDPNSTWQVLNSSNQSRIQERLYFWTPIRAGNYELRLTVIDQAGNQVIDKTRVYFGQRSLAVKNFHVSPIYFSPDGDGYRDEVLISYDVLKATEVLVEIINSEGEVVKSFVNQFTQAQANVQNSWNGLNDNGVLADIGAYQIKVNGFYEYVSLDTIPHNVSVTKYFVRPGSDSFRSYPLVWPFRYWNLRELNSGDIPGYLNNTNIQTSSIEVNLEKFNFDNQVWEAAEPLYAYHFDQFNPLVTEDIYREQLIDEAGNIGYLGGTEFNYLNDKIFSSSIRSVDNKGLSIDNLVAEGCPLEPKKYCGYSGKGVLLNAIQDKRDDGLVVFIQTLSAKTVESIKLDIYADLSFSSSYTVSQLNRTEAEQYLDEDELVAGDNHLPFGVIPIMQKGKRYYVHAFHINNEDLDIDFNDVLDFRYTVNWESGESSIANVKFVKDFETPRGVLLDISENLFQSKEIPDDVINHNALLVSDTYRENLEQSWDDFMADIRLDSSQRYFLKYELQKDSDSLVTTDNNRLDIFYKDGVSTRDITPLKEFFGSADGDFYSLILFEKNLRPCQEISDINWSGVTNEGFIRDLNIKEEPVVDSSFCVINAGYNQSFSVGQYCDSSAQKDNVINLLLLFDTRSNTKPMAFAEAYIYEDNEKISLYTDTNPQVEDELFTFNLQLNKADFLSGDYWVFIDLVSTEGHKTTYFYLLLNQKENVVPQLVEPKNGQKVCAHTGGIIDIPISNLVSNSSSHHYQLTASWLGGQNVLANDGDDTNPEINYEADNLLYGGDWQRLLQQQHAGYYSIEPENFTVQNYDGPVDLTIETLNTTGVSSCHAVTIDVDALIEGQIEFTGDKVNYYLSPNNDGLLDSGQLAEVAADEPMVMKAEIWQNENLLGLAETKTLAPGQLYGLIWDGYLDGQVLADGDYDFKVTLRDDCGLVLEEEVTVSIDTTVPEFLFESPTQDDQVPGIFDVSVFLEELNLDNEAIELGYVANNIFNPIDFELEELAIGIEFTDKVTGSINLSGLSLGEYPLTIKATDLAGNENEATITVHRVDPQEIIWQFQRTPSVISPNNDAIKDSTEISLGFNQQATVSVWVSDIDNNPVKQLLTDTVLSAGTHTIDWLGEDEQNQVVADGDYLIHISAFDPALPALVENLQLTISTDTLAPALSITPHQPVVKGEGSLSIDILEAHPEDNKIYLQALDPLSAESLIFDQGGSGTYDLFDFNELDESSYQLSGNLLDKAGNSFGFTHGFLIDRTAPSVEWLTPDNEGIYGAIDTMTLSGELFEDNLSQFELAMTADTEPYDWQVITDGSEIVDNRFEHEWPINVEDGIYLLRALAIDDADWHTEAIIKVILDQTPPIVSIDSPANQSTQGANITLIGTVTDQNLSNYTISYRIHGESNADWRVIHSDVSEKTNEALFNWQHDLTSGEYDLRVFATDTAGQQSEAMITLQIDAEPPLAPIQLTANLINNHDAQLNWQHPDINEVAGFHVYRNGELITQQLLLTTSLLDSNLNEGQYNYRVFAVDQQGNVSEGSNVASLLVDTIAPKVTLINPLNQALVSSTLDIVGSVEDVDDLASAQLSYRMQGEPLPGTVLYQASLPVTAYPMANLDTTSLLQEQNYLIRLQAEDLSGNLKSVEHAITIDNLSPDAPLNLTHQLIGTSQVDLSWTPNSESDLSGYAVFRNGVIISGGGTIESGQIQQTNYSDENVPDGTYSYYVVAVDQAGNISLPSNTVEIQINRRPPDAWFTSPAVGHKFEAPILVQAMSDDQDIATMLFEYSTDGSQWVNLNTDNEAPFDAVLDPHSLGLDFGGLQIRVTATDEGGQIDASPDIRAIEYTDLTAPNPIDGLSASVNGGDISLSWVANSEADLAGYLMSRKQLEPVEEADYTLLTAVAITDTNYNDTGFTDGTYQYRVVAMDDYDNQSSAVTSEELTVFSVILKQPYSPVLTPAEVIFRGISPQVGELQISLSNVNGSQTFAPISLDTTGEFETTPVTLSLDDNTLSVGLTNAEGHQSKTGHKTIQISPVPSTPINESGVENNYVIDYNWQSPGANSFAYLPYLNGQPVFNEERIINDVTLSASSSEFNLPLVLDEDENTYWSPNWSDVNNGEPVYIQLNFDSPKWLTSTLIQWDDGYYSDARASAPETYLLQYLSNGVWITQTDYTGNTNLQVTYQGDVPYLTTAVRIYMPLEADNFNNIRLREFDVTHQPLTDQLSYSQTVPDGEHHLQVSAVNNYGFESDLTSGLNFTVGDIVPPEPVILSGQVVDTYNAHLSWQSSVSNDVAKYRLYRNNSLLHLTADALVLDFQDVGLANGEYTYRVAAIDEAGNQSSLSNEVVLNIASEPILAPQNLVVESNSEGGQLNLKWDAVNDPNLAFYQIYRSLQPNTQFEARLQSNDVEAIDDVLNNIAYYYYVTAVDTFGNESPPSNIESGTARDLTQPEKPVIKIPTTAGYPISVSHTRVAISGNATPNSEIDLYHNGQWTNSVNSSTDYLLTQTSFDDYYDNIRFNRVNDLIAYNDYMTGQIVIEDTESGHIVPVTLQNVKGQLNQWSHNGERLYVVSGYGNSSSLYEIDTNGAETQTSLVNTTIDFIDISNNENRAVYVGEAFNDVSQQSEYGLWLYDFALQTTEKLLINDDIELSQDAIVWVDDNQQVLFINFANGDYNNGQLWRYGVQTQSLEQLDVMTAAFATLSADSQLNYAYYDDEDNGLQFITRLSLNDLTTVNFSMPGTETIMPVVGIDPDIALINIDCCEKALVNLLTGEILAEFSGFDYRTPALWRDDGHIVAVESEEKFIFIPPGYFVFKDVSLIAGANDFFVNARKSNGLLSEPSENISINLWPESLPDLEILDHYIHLSPEDLSPNEALNGSIVIKNNGTVDVAQVSVTISLIKPDLSPELVLNSPIQVSIAAADVYVKNFVLPGMQSLGEYSLFVEIDKESQVIESNEHNNSAQKTFFVLAEQQPYLELDIEQSNLAPQETLTGQISVYNPTVEFDGSVEIRITDLQGYSVGFEETHAIQALSSQQSWQTEFNWNTEAVFAGEYQVHATLYDRNQNEISSLARNISLGAFSNIDLEIYSTNSQPLQAGIIDLSTNIDYTDGNSPINGHLLWEIKDEQNQTVWQYDGSIGQLNPANRYTYNTTWPVNDSGQYVLTVTLTAQGLSQSATLPMTIMPTQSTININGDINTNGSDLILGENFVFEYDVENQSETTLTNLPVSLIMYNSDLTQLIFDAESIMTLSADETLIQQVDWPTTSLNLDKYIIVLQTDLTAFGGGEAVILDTLTVDAVDGTPPILDVISPINGGYYPANVNLRAQVSDTWSDISHVTVSLDGAPAMALSNNAIDNQYEKSLAGLSEIQHQLDWSATDAVGQMTVQSTSFIVDATPPNIAISGVAEDGLYANTVFADVTIVEDNLASSQITLNGQVYVPGSGISEEGSYRLSVVATDLAGNRTVNSVSFILDLTAPTVEITYPITNSEVNQELINVTGYTEVNATVTLNTTLQTLTTVSDYQGQFAFADVIMQEGNNSISVHAEDAFGNVGQDQMVQVTYVPPLNLQGSLTLAAEANLGDLINTDYMVENLSQTDLLQLPVELRLYQVANGQQVLDQAFLIDLAQQSQFQDTWQFDSTNLSKGSHRLQLWVNIDQQWQILSEQLILLKDNTGPEIVVNRPIDNDTYAGDIEISVLVTDQYSDIATVSYQLDQSGQWESMNFDGVNHIKSLLLTHGQHQVEFKAIDTENNESDSILIAFSIDSQGPNIQINNPEDGHYYNQDVLLDFQVQDDNEFTSTATINNTITTNGTTISDEGVYLLDINASDEFENSSNKQIQFTIDKTAPEISVISPDDNVDTNNPLITIEGNVNESSEVTLDMNGQSYNLMTTDQLTFVDLPLQPGTNLYSLTAIDQAGNTSAPLNRSINYVQTGGVSGRLWNDLNQDGLFGADESGLDQIDIELTNGEGLVYTGQTDSAGQFDFNDVRTGEYTLTIMSESLITEWFNTTANHPANITVTSDTDFMIHLGFYLAEADIASDIDMSHSTGRILIWMDQPTATYDSNNCDGVHDWIMSKNVSRNWSEQDIIWAKLYDHNGVLIQTEQISFGDMQDNTFTLIDDVQETTEVNLQLKPYKYGQLGARVHAASSLVPAVIADSYYVELGITSTNGNTLWQGDSIQPVCETWNQFGTQRGDLILADVTVFPIPASDDPNSLSQTPLLRQQKQQLVQILDDQNWSYDLVLDSVEFEAKLDEGHYVAYIILSESTQLSEQLQNKLSGVLNAGDGLLIASGAAQLQSSIEAELGIQLEGYYSQASQLNISDTPVFEPDELDIAHDEQALKVSLTSGDSVAKITGLDVMPPANHAMIVNNTGYGRSLFAGFDLLLQATGLAELSGYQSLIIDGINYIQKAGQAFQLNRARMVRFSLQNNGRPVSGKVAVNLPAGVELAYTNVPTLNTSNGFEYDYFLSQDELVEFDFWLKVNESPAMVEFDVHIGDSTEIYDHSEIELIVNQLPDLSASITNCQAGIKPGEQLSYRYLLANNGNIDIDGATAHTTFSDELSMPTWTCNGINGATCPQQSGSGNLASLPVDLPVGGEIIFTMQTTVTAAINNTALVEASVMMPEDLFDIYPDNNSGRDVDTIYNYLFKDGFECAAPGQLSIPVQSLNHNQGY